MCSMDTGAFCSRWQETYANALSISGWTTSAKLRQSLVSYVTRELLSAYKSALVASPSSPDSTPYATADPSTPSSLFPSPAVVDEAIKRGFLRLDHDIVHASVATATASKSKRAAVELLAPAISGSCALLSFYDPRTKLLRVACTGDSRAVLGRRSARRARRLPRSSGTPTDRR